MSATLNAGSFRSDDTLYGVSRTLKSYLRSILMHKHGIRLIPKSANGSRVGSRRGSGFDDADVSSILPIIPYGGFSPVRLEGWLSRRGLRHFRHQIADSGFAESAGMPEDADAGELGQ